MPAHPGGAARGLRRTLVEYESSIPKEQHFLQERWNGPAEVDRVELSFR